MKTSELKEALERIRQNVQSQLSLLQDADDHVNLGHDQNQIAEVLADLALDAERVGELANAVLAKVWR